MNYSDNVLINAIQFGGAKEVLDAKVLLDPHEEQLHLPMAPVERANAQSRDPDVVGQEYRDFFIFVLRNGTVYTGELQMLMILIQGMDTSALVVNRTSAESLRWIERR